MIERIEIKSWNEFDRKVTKLPFRNWLFRGQPEAKWELETSLYRLFEDLQKTFNICQPDKNRQFARNQHEKAMISHFKANAHLYLKSLPPNRESNLEWLSIMQHFGCPTRLLDVTVSPYIALFFALEQGQSDAAVYAFNQKEIRNTDIDVLGEGYQKKVLGNIKRGKAFIIPYEPKQTNERLVAQQGAFLVPSNNYETIDEIIKLYDDLEGALAKKFIISEDLRLEGFQRLRRMNISAASLFPGLEGFCRSLRDQSENISQLKRFEEME